MNDAVPNLITAQDGPVLELERSLLEKQNRIETWFRQQWRETPAPFYSSVDLRNAGFKISPVDTNLFPAGFNNLNRQFDALAVQAIQAAMDKACPSAAGLLLIPENHTRNPFYWEHVATLTELIRKAGFSVRLGSLNPDITRETLITTQSGKSLTLEPLRRDGNRVTVGDFKPCAILLNNDLSGGRPAILEGLDQPMLPPLSLGWSNRLKSQHFGVFREVAHELSEIISLDPWLIDPMFRNCGEINFLKREGEDCLISNVEMLLEDIAAKYKEYGIDREPFVFIKADAGTYGMGVMTARSADDVRALNRKARKHMASAKDGAMVSGAIIQEGVYTCETWGPNKATAEPVVYMVDQHVIGGFYRVHEGRGTQDNLNAPGMRFQMLAFAEACSHPDPACAPDAQPNRFYAYGVVARLAALAAAREVRNATRG